MNAETPDWLRLAVLVSFLILVAWIFYRTRKYDRHLATVFLRNRAEEPRVSAIQSALATLGAECSTFAFTTDRVADVHVCDQIVPLVDGTVGYYAPNHLGSSMWRYERRLYTVVSAEMADWMQRYSKAFTLACSGGGFSIYWVKLSALEI